MNIDQTAQTVKVPNTSTRESVGAETQTTPKEETVAVVQQVLLDLAKSVKKGKAKTKPAASEAKPDKDKQPSLGDRYTAALRASREYAIVGRTNGIVDDTMYRWQKSHWQRLDSKDEIKAFQTWVRDIEPGKAEAKYAVEHTKSATANLLDEDGCDLARMRAAAGNQQIIPTPDGYLRIESDGTIRVLPCDRRLAMTYCVQANLAHDRVRDDIYAPAPVPSNSAFGRFLDFFFPKPLIPEDGTEVRDMLQEACSTILLNECFERALVFSGKGSNGKSTLLSILQAMVPSFAWKLEKAGERFGGQVIETNPKLLVASEVPSYLPDSAIQNLKSLVSWDKTLVDRKYRDPVCVTPQCVVILAANNPIRSSDHSDGALRKLLQIPFAVKLDDKSPERVRNFDRTITGSPREMGYVLDWLLEGAARLLKRGRLPETPEAITALTRDTRIVTDSMYAWACETEIAVDDNARSPKDDIYQHYVRQSTEDGNKAVSKNEFYRRLSDITGVYREAQITDRTGRRVRTVGLRIPPENINAERLCLPHGFLAKV